MNKYITTCPQDSTLEKNIKDASHHQTIIGWENSLRGYMSKYWAKVQSLDKTNTVDKRKRAPWNTTFIRGLINMHKTIWNARNTHINGNTIRETQQRLRQRVIDKVKAIYNENPKLAKRYPMITNINLDDRIRRSTQA